MQMMINYLRERQMMINYLREIQMIINYLKEADDNKLSQFISGD